MAYFAHFTQYFAINKLIVLLHRIFGEMAEWSKAHAWKVCNRQKRFMGSNPILSAPVQIGGFSPPFLFYKP